MTTLRLLATGFTMSLRRALAFRVNLLFDATLAVLSTLSTVATVLIVYARTDTLAGWTRPETFLLIGTFEIVSGLKATFVDPNLGPFGDRAIRGGLLDHHLLRPAPTLYLATLGSAAPLAAVQIPLGLGVLALGVRENPQPIGLGAATAWLVLVCGAAVVTWAAGTLLAVLAFWAPRLDLQPLYGTAWLLARYPAGIYPGPLRTTLTHVVPLALVAAVPAAALAHPPGARSVASSLATAGALALLAVLAWRRGLRRYTGAGG